MSVTIGTERVSEEQQRLLIMCQSGLPRPMLVEHLQRIVTDRDILSGDEHLHPAWSEIFQRSRGLIQQAMGSDAFGRFDSFFSSIEPYDWSIKAIDPNTEKIAFLLGAGASKPHPSDIPTVKELLPELLGRARRLDREQVTHLADYCNDNGISNIEDLLTAVQISEFCSRSPNILNLVEYQLFRDSAPETSRPAFRRNRMRSDISSVAFLQDTLQVLFGLLSNLMLPASPNNGHSAIVKYLNDRPDTPIVTTNYDCCIDLALIEAEVQCNYGVEFANANALLKPGQRGASLTKLHGSLNWFYCETCQAVWLIDIAKAVNDYRNGVGEYPIISVCSQCGGQRRGLLIPPHAMKFDVSSPLQPLIADARRCFESASLIVAVGFSFADADQYIARMISKALQASQEVKLVIIDPSPEVAERVRRKFGAQIPGFNSSNRIIKFQGDCSEVLPLFLRGDLFQKSENNSHTAEPANNGTNEVLQVAP